MAKFATGDVVILVSGSMKMAVESCEDTTVNCVWADGGSVHRAALPEAVLDKYIAPERSSFARPDGPRGGDRGADRGGDRGGFNKPREFGGKPGGGYQGKPGGGRGGFDKPSHGGPRKDFGDKPRGGGGPRRDRD